MCVGLRYTLTFMWQFILVVAVSKNERPLSPSTSLGAGWWSSGDHGTLALTPFVCIRGCHQHICSVGFACECHHGQFTDGICREQGDFNSCPSSKMVVQICWWQPHLPRKGVYAKVPCEPLSKSLLFANLQTEEGRSFSVKTVFLFKF